LPVDRALEVSVRLYASLRRYQPAVGLGQPVTVPLPGPTSLADLIEAVLGLPRGEVAIMLVNGQPQLRDYVLHAGDRVALWPPVAGGAG
jgi:sulfur carrier protein ThiS